MQVKTEKEGVRLLKKVSIGADGLTARERHFRKMLAEAPMILCACGCGESLKSIDRYARPVSYVNGHNQRQNEGRDATRWAVQKRYKANNPDKIRIAKRNYYRGRKLRAMEFLGNACRHCGVRYDGTNAPIFEFHHSDPHDKENGITRILANWTWSRVLHEMSKCILICENCHNKHHGGAW